MLKVAFVYPYFRTRTPTELLFPPLGAASLASQLHQVGIKTRIFDCTFGTFSGLEDSLDAYHPDIVGIYSMVSLSRNTFRIAEMVRQRLPGSLLVAGGPLPTLYPERYTRQFDAVFRGEADRSFPRFCQDYSAEGRGREALAKLPLEHYDGLYIAAGGLQVNTSPVHSKEELLAAFPLPDRSDFDHAAYQKAWTRLDGSKTTSIILTFGCPFHCDFCSRPVFGSLYRRRPLEAVFEEIEQIRALGYDSLWIADDNFTLDLAYLKAFCTRMVGKKIHWSCLSRVTGISAELAAMMKEAGCKRVYLGLETGSETTLRLMKKQATLEQGIEAVKTFHRAGIQVAAFFIVGYPGETLDSIEATFRLALELPLDSISFNVPYPLPGSDLFERVSEIDLNKDWDKENEVTFIFKSDFDPAWLEGRIQETVRTFDNRKS
jgi:anaerobic magnesium-protoporphyrin IX monomethyl ester cyclase